MFEYRSTPRDPAYEARRQALSEAIRYTTGEYESAAEIVAIAEVFHAFLTGGAR